MPRLADSYLTSPQFKNILSQADDYAEENGYEKWPTRIAWIGLVYGPLGAKRFAQRRANYRTSQAWECYCNLTDGGVFSEDPEGIPWDEGTEPWDDDPMLWFNTLIHIAGGGDVPDTLPRIGP